MTTRLAFLAVATTSAVLYACSTGNTGVGGTGDGGSHSGGDSGVILASGDGGATFAANQGNPFGIALDSTNVYWSDVGKFTNAPLSEPNYTIGSGTLMKAPLAGGAPTTLLSGLNWPSSIAVELHEHLLAHELDHRSRHRRRRHADASRRGHSDHARGGVLHAGVGAHQREQHRG